MVTVQSGSTPWVLTGAIGTGKSTVGSMLAARGARVIDADRIGHAVIDPAGAGFSAVARRWPHTVVDGKVDRRALGAVVFNDSDQLRELESITHPLIVNRLAELISASRDAVAVVVEVSVPHLPLDRRWGRIVVVAGDPVRRARLISRGLASAEVDQRMAAQPSPLDWVSPGDIVVHNDGDLQELESAVERLWDRLTRAA